MKKKNLLLMGSAALLSLALAGTIGVVAASADPIASGGSSAGTVTVKYNVADTWSVTIPESITVEGDSASVEVTQAKIEKNKQLKVKVSSESVSDTTTPWSVSDSESNKIEYELKGNNGSGTTLKNGDTVLMVQAGSTGSENVKATLKNSNDAKYSTGGEDYEDTLTFTVSVEVAE